MNNDGTFSELPKDKIVMAVRGNNLIYIADGEASKMEEIKESFKKVLNVPVIAEDIVDGCNIRELRDNTVLLNERYNYLIEPENRG